MVNIMSSELFLSGVRLGTSFSLFWQSVVIHALLKCINDVKIQLRGAIAFIQILFLYLIVRPHKSFGRNIWDLRHVACALRLRWRRASGGQTRQSAQVVSHMDV